MKPDPLRKITLSRKNPGTSPKRGEVWWAYLDPTVGREQAGRRPVLVVSRDDFNAGPSGLVLAMPLTTSDRQLFHHVPIDPPEAAVKRSSVLMTDQLRSLSIDRLKRRIGAVSPTTVTAVELRLRILLDL